MINYEIAKKLKEAGFKQKGFGIFIGEGGIITHRSTSSNAAWPDMEELIFQCLPGFRWLKNRNGNWLAQGRIKTVSGDIRAYGNTPDEALANLWIKQHDITK